jgi:hypothetical protein
VTAAGRTVPAAASTRHRPRAATVVLSAIVLAGVIPLALFTIAALVAGQLADVPFYLVFLLLPANLGVVGAVLTVRRPENRIGWLLLTAGVFTAVVFATGEYHRLIQAEGAPETAWSIAAAWVASWAFLPAVGILVVFLPLLFPTGELIGPRWRVVVAVALAGMTAGTLGAATAPGALAGPNGPPNPVVPPEPLLSVITAAAALGNAVAPVVFLLALASLLLRFRASRGVERQQITWFLLAASLSAVLFAVSLFPLGGIADVAWALGLLSLAFLPIAIGVAILRYRLYEIDRIVSRVVGYAIVTAVLAAVFAGVVVVAAAVLAPVTQSNTLAVAGSTLVVAALFQPVRRATQSRVDRRFNRSRVRADHVAEAFSARIREGADLPTIGTTLREGVATTLAPSSVGIWVRGRAPSRGARSG